VYKKLGQGAFGTVSKAVDMATGSLWAVKECRQPDGEVMDEAWKTSFKHEVEKLARLRHVSLSLAPQHFSGRAGT
jgi:serine/threonine protein kinase